MKNRLHNSKNPFQGDALKVLCVCSAGLLRSPTIAWVLSNEPFNCNTRAVGASESFALILADEVLCHWADVIICVEEAVFTELSQRIDLDNVAARLICLDLPDEFNFKDPALVELSRKVLLEKFSELNLL